MQFKIAGKNFNLTPDEVRRRMQGIEPEVVQTHAVELNGTLYPVKQVISVATGLPRADFNSHEARRILRRMGFQVVVTDKASTQRKK